MSNLIIIGAGGHGRVVAESAELSGRWNCIEFLDDNLARDERCDDWPVVGTLQSLDQHQGVDFFVAIGDNETRHKLYLEGQQCGLNAVSIIHPKASVSRYAHLGVGCFVSSGAIINIGALIGDYSIVNTGATVDHDCKTGDAVHISPGANVSGGVFIGCCSWIGTGVSIKNDVVIGKNVVVGVGAAVVSNLEEGRTYAGIPARAL